MTPPTQGDATVSQDPDGSRWTVQLDGEVVGSAYYRRTGDRVVFTHTEVSPAVEGQGVGSTLVRSALDDVREQGLQAVPSCPFVAAFIERHTEYADLVAS